MHSQKNHNDLTSSTTKKNHLAFYKTWKNQIFIRIINGKGIEPAHGSQACVEQCKGKSTFVTTMTYLTRHVLRELGIDLVDGQLLEAEMHHDEVVVSDALSCPRTKGPHSPVRRACQTAPGGAALLFGGAQGAIDPRGGYATP